MPKVHYKGQQGEFYVMVMDLLGSRCGLLRVCALWVGGRQAMRSAGVHPQPGPACPADPTPTPTPTRRAHPLLRPAACGMCGTRRGSS